MNPEELIRKLEKETGIPHQIVIETADDSIFVQADLYKSIVIPCTRQIIGSFEERSCTVRPITTNNADYLHDAELITGEYVSLNALQKRLGDLEKANSFCTCYSAHDAPTTPSLMQHLSQFAHVEKAIVEDWGVDYNWYLVDGKEANLFDWKYKRPDLYDATIDFLISHRIEFICDDLIATPKGVFTYSIDMCSGDIDTLRLEDKIANVQISLLK